MDFSNGDINTSIIKTHLGRTIMVQDCSNNWLGNIIASNGTMSLFFQTLCYY
jgi:hypothetical protein